MLNPELTRALADERIHELHRRADHTLPVSAASARFLGLQALGRGHLPHLPHLTRRARTAARAAAAAASTTTAPATGHPAGSSPMGCAA
ncbi:hypothetical protein [Oryzihumus leptocrescens]|uniref:Uncharacterized protein n=1 Tax=Oryzihumus leptocrescens TaxID=297536 RepID=A0A542ZJY3_9MICO|nr:hypothetical protein [Oryzihumus leptocrescens]TQL60662.1 hypothetical protein FB474_2058 [Oryzihumus leptocrescens]